MHYVQPTGYTTGMIPRSARYHDNSVAIDMKNTQLNKIKYTATEIHINNYY